LKLHSSLPSVGRLRPAANKAVNFFFDVDERLFHAAKA
jgi:hypothetical protein